MAIKISLESTVIPVQIGDLKFEIDVSDEKYEEIVSNFNGFLEKISELDEEKAEDVVQLKDIVKEIYDQLLGEGAYEKIYAKMSNVSFVVGVLVNLVTQLTGEMEKRMILNVKTKAVTRRKPAKKQVKK